MKDNYMPSTSNKKFIQIVTFSIKRNKDWYFAVFKALNKSHFLQSYNYIKQPQPPVNWTKTKSGFQNPDTPYRI